MIPRTAALGLLLLATFPVAAQDEPAAAQRDSGIVEREDVQLAQIDVTVLAPLELLGSLTAEDFRLKINLTEVKEFQLDRVCSGIDEAVAPETAALRPPAHYVLYFDQPHLTLVGRAQALDTARDLAPRLLAGGARLMIVSNADRLVVVQPFTGDGETISAALTRLEHDRRQWTMFAETEDDRVAEVLRVLNEEEQVGPAIAMARRYHKEDVAMTDRNMRRLQLTVSQLVDLPAPKALIYFGDTLRKQAGEHFLSLFGDSLRRSDAYLNMMNTSSGMAGLSFDSVVNAAAAQGTRLYTVQAEGLVERMHSALPGARGLTNSQQVTAPRAARSRSARDTLRGMAAESGGRAFLQGASGDQIADGILEDGSCLFLLSFDPSRFDRDQPLRVVVSSRRGDIEVRSRGRLVVQSPAARRTASLLRAFGSPESIDDPFELRATMIPTGFEGGKYAALVQLSIPGTPLPSPVWELGATIVHRERVHDETSERFELDEPGVPVVLEREVRLPPGEYEVTAVAHEVRTGLISSVRRTFSWPDPNDRPVTAGPIALVQPQAAAFSREGATRARGSMARVSEELVDPELPVALIGIVCRGRRHRGATTIDRELVGDRAVPLPELEFEFGEDRCAQLRDLIPENAMGPGRYRYRIVLRTGEEIEQLAELEFLVAP